MKGPAEVAHGPMFAGFTINVLLYGIMITQVYLYYTTYRNDKRYLKALVLLLFVADTANSIFDFVYLYRALIVHFDQPEYLAKATWLFATDPAITGIIACLVQLFFSWRVRVLTRSWAFGGLVFVGSLAGLAGAVATSVEVIRVPEFTEFRQFKAVVIIWLASESVTDILITTILVWFLKRHKTGFHASDQIVDRIIRITVQTGLLTSLVATLDLIFFLSDPTGTHLIFNFPLCKLYTNSLMSSLNSRRGWRFDSTDRHSVHVPTGVGAGTGTNSMHTTSMNAAGMMQAHNNNNTFHPHLASTGQGVHSELGVQSIKARSIGAGTDADADADTASTVVDGGASAVDVGCGFDSSSDANGQTHKHKLPSAPAPVALRASSSHKRRRLSDYLPRRQSAHAQHADAGLIPLVRCRSRGDSGSAADDSGRSFMDMEINMSVARTGSTLSALQAAVPPHLDSSSMRESAALGSGMSAGMRLGSGSGTGGSEYEPSSGGGTGSSQNSSGESTTGSGLRRLPTEVFSTVSVGEYPVPRARLEAEASQRRDHQRGKSKSSRSARDVAETQSHPGEATSRFDVDEGADRQNEKEAGKLKKSTSTGLLSSLGRPGSAFPRSWTTARAAKATKSSVGATEVVVSVHVDVESQTSVE